MKNFWDLLASNVHKRLTYYTDDISLPVWMSIPNKYSYCDCYFSVRSAGNALLSDGTPGGLHISAGVRLRPWWDCDITESPALNGGFYDPTRFMPSMESGGGTSVCYGSISDTLRDGEIYQLTGEFYDNAGSKDNTLIYVPKIVWQSVPVKSPMVPSPAIAIIQHVHWHDGVDVDINYDITIVSNIDKLRHVKISTADSK